MSKSAYIRLVPGSKQSEISLDELKQLFFYYQKMTGYTGDQLQWDYRSAAFPYLLEEQEQNGRRYLLLQGREKHLYHHLIAGVGTDEEFPYVQIVLPTEATHGDTAKANEFSRFLAKQLQAELHMFNGRTMYFNKRK